MSGYDTTPASKRHKAEPDAQASWPQAGEKLKALNVLIVRHGESQQNVMSDSDQVKKDAVLISKMEEVFNGSIEAWDVICGMAMDPSLTSLGFAQAERLAAYAAPLADNVGKDGKVCMFVSPHLRTCQTAHPHYLALQTKKFVTAAISEDIYEAVGIPKIKIPKGIWNPSDSPEQKVAKVGPAMLSLIDKESEGNGLCARQIKEDFGYDTSKMKNGPEKGWYNLKKFETIEETGKRAEAVMEWLFSKELYQTCASQAPNGNPWVVLVAHGKFNELLMQHLMGTSRGAFDQDNTGVSHFSIQHKFGKPPQPMLCSMNQLEHLWTIPHSFGAAPLPANYQPGKSGPWNNYGRN